MPMSYSAPIGGSYSGPITGGSYSAPIGKPISYGAPIGQPQMGTLGTVSQVIPASAVPISEGKVVPGTQRAVESSQHWWIGYPEDEPLPGCNIPSHYCKFFSMLDLYTCSPCGDHVLRASSLTMFDCSF